MYEKTTIAIAFAAGALLSGVVTTGSSMVFERFLFAQGGRIEVPATPDAVSRAGAIPSGAPLQPTRQISVEFVNRNTECPGERPDGRVSEFVATRRVLARGVTTTIRDDDASGSTGRPCGRRMVRTPAEV
ncbi:MAG TPA: hypothetical protein VF104_02245 [Burkholderiales bacterium]